MVVSFVVHVGRVILGGHDTIPDVFQEFSGFVVLYFPKKKAFLAYSLQNKQYSAYLLD